MEQRTIEILSQVVYKEMCQDRRTAPLVEELMDREKFWKAHESETLELARNILRVNNTINKFK